jgi:hypothetical protein
MIALVILILGITTFATLCVSVMVVAPSAATIPHRPRPAHPAKDKVSHGTRRAYAAANDNVERDRRRRAF